MGNLKTSFGGAYHAFDFSKHGIRYLAAFVYRFNRRFHLETLPTRLLVATVAIGPRPATWLRQAEGVANQEISRALNIMSLWAYILRVFRNRPQIEIFHAQLLRFFLRLDQSWQAVVH